MHMDFRTSHLLGVAIMVTGITLTTVWAAYLPPSRVSATASAAAPMSLPPAPQIHAKAGVVYDALSGTMLYEKESSAQLPIASITKVMTVLVAREFIEPEESINIPAASLAREGESGLKPGDVWEAQDLFDYVLVTSSNDGAEALAIIAAERMGGPAANRSVFVERMNSLGREIGLQQAYFLDPTGLDVSASMAGAYASASDVARLLVYAARTYPDTFASTAKDGLLITSDEASYTAHNTNKALGAIPGLIAGKTGYTDLAGGNLAVAFDAGVARPIAVVVLGSTRDGRFEDVERLVAFARDSLATTTQ